MIPFEIFQIGQDVEPTAGIPEGCELCGHCRMLRGVLAEGTPLPCGAAAPRSRSSEQTTRGAN